MGNSINDYLLDLSQLSWSDTLRTWTWLLPSQGDVWLVNRFGDLFLVVQDGSVHLLDVGAGSLEPVASSKVEFREKLQDPECLDQWFLPDLVDALVAAGIELKPGQCYAFKQLPVLGGEYEVANFAPLDAAEWIRCCGSIHLQLRDLPDGTEVSLKVTD
jgi:hypothetical protein